ncbi:MAG TPA: DUF418 domain-containing protein [Bradyrhizobium sp.]|nr:DUF418 domain-containing protein [Bradyrhizobium sp.]
MLAINVVNEFRVSFFEEFLPVANTTGTLDRAVQTFLTMAIALKAMALFSLLFGIGMAIQFERLTPNPRRCMLLMRRLAILLVIGVAHLFLIWNGDILTEYSLAGFIALPFLWGPRWLLAAGASLFLALYLVMPLLPPIVPWPTTAWITHHVAEARQVYGTGGFLEILTFRIGETASILPLHVFILPRTIALFLFGMFVWRADVIRRPATHGRLLVTVAIVGVVVGAALTVASEEPALLGLPLPGRMGASLERLATLLLATGYAAAIIGFVSTRPGMTMLAWAAPLGRMAFTNYLAQSIVFGWIFYGYGLGLFGRVGVVTALAIGVCVYVAQVMISAQWLRYYRFGPIEWLWRSLMYGTAQRLRIRQATPSGASA